ncbi:SinI family restriction endonuclease [Bifidobacterium oedipodis]|uniref:SinI family restriction endonuclease n=1 Tax=Bifidobacterium oedipodis TaxID=2675322 RepID=A0A7Y0EPN9_9BIFI|nr:SinI family restriction endonuclease [Bifidobacterium sp. DSM 109957]NMM94146.1 SinI family restriction endonuclease [Bifidobacterium sp. DSM 109957]
MPKERASKEKVYDKLSDSLNWCNSHDDYAQKRFSAVVDIQLPRDLNADFPMDLNKQMKALFPVLLQDELRGYRPNIAMNKEDLALAPSAFLDLWFSKWVRKFKTAWDRGLPSQQVAKPKQAATDPALIAIVAAHMGDNGALAGEYAWHHNLFMSAENVGGNLLEEYIAFKAKDYGWIWCRGEVLTAVDFCNTDCSCFIQIKNKSNTENSSGKGYRQDHDARVWYRMNAKRIKGEIVTYWPELIDVIREGTKQDVPDDLLNESDYLSFVSNASQSNEKLITDTEEGIGSTLEGLTQAYAFGRNAK